MSSSKRKHVSRRGFIRSTAYAAAVACLVGLGLGMGLAFPYFAGCALALGVLIYKHVRISPGDTSRLGVAFFRINAYVSTIVFGATLLAVLMA